MTLLSQLRYYVLYWLTPLVAFFVLSLLPQEINAWWAAGIASVVVLLWWLLAMVTEETLRANDR